MQQVQRGSTSQHLRVVAKVSLRQRAAAKHTPQATRAPGFLRRATPRAATMMRA